MLSNNEKEQYSRHLQLENIGTAGQLKLKQSKVLVIGAGGLGCSALLYLTAAGVGTIGIIDHDTVSRSNLQRQVIYGVSSIGKHKVAVAIKHLSDINPNIKLNPYNYQLTSTNASQIIKKYDLIIDCSDNLPTRYIINDACVLNNKPFIYGAIYKFEGQIAVFNYNNGPTYRCLFDKKEQNIPNCSELGVIGTLPGIIGTMQADEALKLIIGHGNSLNGKLMLYNSLNNQNNIISIHRKEHAIYDRIINQQGLSESDYIINEICDSLLEIEMDEFIELLNKNIQIIDVRLPLETPFIKELNAINIPAQEISNHLDKLDLQKSCVLICQSGKRSLKAVQEIKKHSDIQYIYSLKDGLKNWKKIKDKIVNTYTT